MSTCEQFRCCEADPWNRCDANSILQIFTHLFWIPRRGKTWEACGRTTFTALHASVASSYQCVFVLAINTNSTQRTTHVRGRTGETGSGHTTQHVDIVQWNEPSQRWMIRLKNAVVPVSHTNHTCTGKHTGNTLWTGKAFSYYRPLIGFWIHKMPPIRWGDWPSISGHWCLTSNVRSQVNSSSVNHRLDVSPDPHVPHHLMPDEQSLGVKEKPCCTAARSSWLVLTSRGRWGGENTQQPVHQHRGWLRTKDPDAPRGLQTCYPAHTHTHTHTRGAAQRLRVMVMHQQRPAAVQWRSETRGWPGLRGWCRHNTGCDRLTHLTWQHTHTHTTNTRTHNKHTHTQLQSSCYLLR